MTFPIKGTRLEVELPASSGLRGGGLWIGKGQLGLEVVCALAARRPPTEKMLDAWKHRQGGRPTPVLLAASYPDDEGRQLTALCGPTGDKPPVVYGVNPSVAARICEEALSEPDRHSAIRFLRSILPEADSPLVGLRNEGFLATHELEFGVPKRRDWAELVQKARSALGFRGRPLIEALGFKVREGDGRVDFLLAGSRKVAVAAFLDRDETPDRIGGRFPQVSPISYAMAKADEEGVPHVVVTSGPTIRVYPTRPVGVGQRGRAETFIEADLRTLPEEKAPLLTLLFSADALEAGGTLERILEDSRSYMADLGKRLRERIYGQVVPNLAKAIALARGASPDAEELETVYEMTLTVLFRTLFVAYAEDKGLLPYRTNEFYRMRSLKQKALEILALARLNRAFDESATHWDDLARLFDAINEGRAEWGIPPYDGGLFSQEANVSSAGSELRRVSLPNTVFGPILHNLLLDESEEGLGPIDFRSLGVREFGTIYEGLLESELGVAEQNLTVDADGFYSPAKRTDEVMVKRGAFYLSSSSGKRKSTGSYFTKRFAVDHLLDYALEPALDAHVARLGTLSDDAAGEVFFDFRVADIAMGSGHFLVAAVDRIERRLSSFLAKRPLRAALDELSRLRAAAHTALGDLAEETEIEDGQLLRRQIGRRCIYGVDLNAMAVELARLSLWTHTFVPGLPLSFLDQHLVRGDSLVGVATVNEAEDLLERSGLPGVKTVFAASARELMRHAAEGMLTVARLSEATAAEVRKAREEWARAKEEAEPWRALLDILAASRLDENLAGQVRPILDSWIEDPTRVLKSRELARAREVLAAIPPFHFPVAFPEISWRERPGFDVILGNPPWEKLHVEEHEFWARNYPGLRGLSQRERDLETVRLRKARPDLVRKHSREVDRADLARAVLMAGPFPGLGSGHPDLYKAFCWRFWDLLSVQGFMGVVLPRSTFSAAGSEEFRRKLLEQGRILDLTMLLNTGNWVFDDAEPRYTISLVAFQKKAPDRATRVFLRGPYSSLARYRKGVEREPLSFSVSDVLRWTETAALPLLPDEASGMLFVEMQKATPLGLKDRSSWKARPLQGDINATTGKPLMDFSESRPKGFWPVFSGESFDLWTPETGKYYAWIDPHRSVKHLAERRLKSASRENSVFSEMPATWTKDPKTLPCLHPRIAFRDVTNRTNRRTVIVALVPPEVILTHKAPFLLWPAGDEKDQAYLLGVLSSIPFDWYARRFVEVTVSFSLLMSFPVPRPPRTDPRWLRVVELAGRLAGVDRRFKDWVDAVGAGLNPPTADAREDMVAELDAIVAHLYGLTEDQFRHLFETFHEGWDYQARMKAAIRHYQTWVGRA